MIRRIAAFVAAVVTMVVLGSLAHSWFVQQAWLEAAAIGGSVPDPQLTMSERLTWMTHDLIGLQPLYGALTGIALLVAFLASGLVARFTGLRTIVFAVAGAVAIFVMFTVMKSQLGTVGVFGARGTMGLGAQVIAGLIAGLVFAIASRPQSDS
jgi:hypothetical protein